MKFTKSTIYAVMIATAASLGSCDKSSDDPSTDEQTERDATFQTIAEQYVNNTVIATYKDLADQTEQLTEKLAALKAEKTDANVQAACDIFLEARASWEKSEAFLYGAASDFGIDPHIDSWPLDLDGLLTALNNTAQIEAMAGEDGDVYAGEKLGNSLLGFHGIEYIIFENGGAKPASSISDLQLIYATAVAGDLRNCCYRLHLSWAGEDAVEAPRLEKVQDLDVPYTINGGTFSYGENMLKAGQAGSTYSSKTAAMLAIVDGCKTIADEVGTSKIGKPYTGEDVNYIESPYSYKSIQDFYDNMVSIENAYKGGAEGKRDESKSLHSYVSSINPTLDKQVTDAIDEAKSKIMAMKAPFVQNYTDPSAGEAIEACKALDNILSTLKNELGNR